MCAPATLIITVAKLIWQPSFSVRSMFMSCRLHSTHLRGSCKMDRKSNSALEVSVCVCVCVFMPSACLLIFMLLDVAVVSYHIVSVLLPKRHGPTSVGIESLLLPALLFIECTNRPYPFSTWITVKCIYIYIYCITHTHFDDMLDIT